MLAKSGRGASGGGSGRVQAACAVSVGKAEAAAEEEATAKDVAKDAADDSCAASAVDGAAVAASGQDLLPIKLVAVRARCSRAVGEHWRIAGVGRGRRVSSLCLPAFFDNKRPRVVPKPPRARTPELPSSNVPKKTEKTKQNWLQCPNEKRDENNIQANASEKS